MHVAADVMTRTLVTLNESDLLTSADVLLDLGHIRHLPVVRGRKLVGLVTHRDLLRHCMRSDPQTGRPVRAKDVMAVSPTTVGPDTSMREAIRLMLSNKFGCLPVTQDDGTLVGIITESDLLRVADQRIEEIDRRESAAEYDADA
jgi:CBS domain-containing protein